ncbi:hypothetical protein ACFPAG_16105 [Vogesella sp. GCM10023246]|uniref:DUF11 domain-containing protein n=1 Tax=Vogesella oryzagri TaxID=3160864 RepID=A0ABV1M9B9_9NEIS
MRTFTLRNFLTAAGLCMAVMMSGITPTYAIDTLGLFELEKNANAVDESTTGEDWSTVNAGTYSGPAIARTGLVPDPAPQSIFTTGGSKDVSDVSQWRFTDGSVPDKDNITNAYAAAYIDPAHNNHLIFYFGLDRSSNDGDAQLGFWFFKDKVAPKSGGTFNGVHQVGDLLILVNVTQGGAVGNIEVLKWVGTGGDIKGGTLQRLAGGPGTSVAQCGDSGLPSNHTYCASFNSSDQTAPWGYTPKSGSPGTFPPISFFEGGIDVTETLGTDVCFSAFMAETRSSQSETAQLKDFVLHSFQTCKISVSKSCSVTRLTTSQDNTSKFYLATYTATVKNEGSGSLPTGSVITIVDDVGTPGDTSDDQTKSQTLASPLAVNGTVSFTDTFFTDDNPPVNTVTAKTVFGSTTIVADPASVKCSPLQLNPKLVITKDCSTVLDVVNGQVVVKVNYSGYACVQGDVPLKVTITDAPKNGADSSSLPSQVLVQPTTDNCVSTGVVPYSGSYTPSQANGGITDPSTAQFSDTVTAIGTNPALQEDQKATITATCPLCN